MPKDKLNCLLQTDSDVILHKEEAKEFRNSKRMINGICESLSLETQKYDPDKTFSDIASYLESNDKLDRILYSEISNYIFSLETAERGIFATNLEKLLLYSLNKNDKVLEEDIAINEACKKIIIKLYDHFHLILYQVENVNRIFATGIDGTKEDFKQYAKSIETEYITILGIFAAIVLTFVGGATFSTSVLQNISDVNIFRLLLVIDFLAFSLMNIIYVLVKFIFVINGKDTNLLKIKSINKACIFIAIFILLGWILNINLIPAFISSFLPWTN